MNDRHPSGDPHPPAPDAGHASYASYDQQSAHYGDGYSSYDGYDAYANGSVATATTTFPVDSGHLSATTGFPADSFATGSYAPGAFAGTDDYDADPLFGDLPGTAPTSGFATDAYGTGQWSGSAQDPYGTQPQTGYGAGGWDTTGHTGAGQDMSGQWDATAWAGGGPSDTGGWETAPYGQESARPYDAPGFDGLPTDPAATAVFDLTGPQGAPGHAPSGYDTHGGPGTGGFGAPGYDETTAFEQPLFDQQVFDQQGFDQQGFDQQGFQPQGFDEAAYDTSSYASPYDAQPPTDLGHAPGGPGAPGHDTAPAHAAEADPHADPYADHAPADHAQPAPGTGDDGYDTYDDAYRSDDGYDDADGHQDGAGHRDHTEDDGRRYENGGTGRRAPAAAPRRAPGRGPGRGSGARRRTPPKRSALLTVAVPSVCVIGVAGAAAASVMGGDDQQSTTASDIKPSEANNKLDTQLDNLSAGTRDFADRASRTQERIDLKAQQEAERRKKAEEAARKERLRPKFALPVTQHGLSAYFGQAGVNWMSVHTGIDFPVAYGTQVMAATDGTVRFQYNTAYGNMAIVTAKDGTETWYCHLSSYRVSSGTAVKAGDVIAFSGNSGNSTGPHMHFEVRPNGGAAIDPLPWLRSHGLDPT